MLNKSQNMKGNNAYYMRCVMIDTLRKQPGVGLRV